MWRRVGIVVLVAVAVACGGPDPVSTGIGADAPEHSSVDSSTTELPATTPSPTTTARPTTTSSIEPVEQPGVRVPSTTQELSIPDDPSSANPLPESDSPYQAALVGFGDDEPTFDPEPLQPFVDLTELPTGWAAFDFFLADALLRNGNTAASVAVSIGGEIVHRAAIGERAPLPVDAAEPQDRFRIASISKTLTAITLLGLVEDGIVGLDEPIGRRVAEHVGLTSSPASIEAITPRHLLNHTAGFGKYRTVFFGGGADDCTDAARIGLDRSPSSNPGGTYRYSNMNYCVAGELIEALTGNDYDDEVYARVLTPLGISGPRLAATFDPGPDEILHPTTLGRNYMETLGGAGGWIATPADLVAVLDALDPSTTGHTLLTPETLEMMKTPVNGQRGQRGYGLGLLLYGGDRYGHTGTIEATHAMAMNRGDGVTWAITVSGPYPDDTPRLESIINRAFEAGGFVTT
ncbi:MAG: serine hydrolase domain-containing protein [Acidimicrobiia bacterium]|nr:serine hydrolase domain-containing protein [Acidimicrobiia bacterium]